MKANSRFTASIIGFGILIAAQIVFILLPGRMVIPFIRICRPLLYFCLAAALFLFIGKDERPVPLSQTYFLLAGIGALLYYSAMLITGVLCGFGKNAMVADFSAVLQNTWIYATVALLSEYLRAKLIKRTSADNRLAIASMLTMVYTFVQIDAVRTITALDFSSLTEFFFATVFPVLILNTVLSYIALEGSLAALLLIRGVYSLSPFLIPLLPNVSRTVWALISCTVLFFTAIIFHRNISVNNYRSQYIAKRHIKYQKKSFMAYAISAAVIVLLAAFFLRAFVYFPAVVLSGSMTGTIDRGSIVIVQKLREKNVVATINEGDIINYTNNKIEVVHRVIELRYNTSNEQIYITKGDANTVIDSNPVEVSQVIGIVKAHIPYIGYPLVIIRAIFSG
ncbi:MAG: signal peptidase I [Firmicutes bacterium]|nr:signal peptidase I [Bacillota bacterium]